MNSSLKSQQGLTLLSIAFILALIGFFVLLALNIVPIYLDHSKVKNALNALKEDPGFADMSEFEIRRSLDKRFNLNYVYDVTQDDIKVLKTGSYTKVDIEYETVKKLAFNLSVLAEFHDVIEAGVE
ncbi:DUF4845 domain-containing protein [Methylosarcina fibrata]|uniref:DUF4845 domain-containing protein n=1 Tax=Methylosarcina fibrata TaxID=105972 RepID=UPI00036CD843|nr:DUF4845 domain-containing protein [Methylosarcina fibrata]